MEKCRSCQQGTEDAAKIEVADFGSASTEKRKCPTPGQDIHNQHDRKFDSVRKAENQMRDTDTLAFVPSAADLRDDNEHAASGPVGTHDL